MRSLATAPRDFRGGIRGPDPRSCLAILFAYLPEKEAVALYQDFKFKFIATLSQEDFEKEMDIRGWTSENRNLSD